MLPRLMALLGLAALVFPPLSVIILPSYTSALARGNPPIQTPPTHCLLSEELVSSVGGTPPSFFFLQPLRLTHDILHLQDLIRSSDETN